MFGGGGLLGLFTGPNSVDNDEETDVERGFSLLGGTGSAKRDEEKKSYPVRNFDGETRNRFSLASPIRSLPVSDSRCWRTVYGNMAALAEGISVCQ